MKRTQLQQQQARQRAIQSINSQTGARSDFIRESMARSDWEKNKPVMEVKKYETVSESPHPFASLAAQQASLADASRNAYEQQKAEEARKQKAADIARKEAIAEKKLQKAINELNLTKQDWDEKYKLERKVEQATANKANSLSNDMAKAIKATIDGIANSQPEEMAKGVESYIKNTLASQGIIEDLNNGGFTSVDSETLSNITDKLADEIMARKDEITNDPKIQEEIDKAKLKLTIARSYARIISNSKAWDICDDLFGREGGGIDTLKLIDDIKAFAKEIAGKNNSQEVSSSAPKWLVNVIQGITKAGHNIFSGNKVGVADKTSNHTQIVKHSGLPTQEEYDEFKRKVEEGRKLIEYQNSLIVLPR